MAISMDVNISRNSMIDMVLDKKSVQLGPPGIAKFAGKVGKRGRGWTNSR